MIVKFTLLKMFCLHHNIGMCSQSVADPGGGGGGGGGAPPGARAPPPPPFRSSNYIFIVAQYSVLNCILNVQLSKTSALRAGGGISPSGDSRTHPLSVNHAHFSLNSNFSLLVPPPPPSPFKVPGSAPGQSLFLI